MFGVKVKARIYHLRAILVAVDVLVILGKVALAIGVLEVVPLAIEHIRRYRDSLCAVYLAIEVNSLARAVESVARNDRNSLICLVVEEMQAKGLAVAQ